VNTVSPAAIRARPIVRSPAFETSPTTKAAPSAKKGTTEHPLLREPFTVRAADLRVLATCGDDGAPGRFPIAADPSWELYGQGQSGWLWTKAWGSPLPILGVAPDPPNVALLFEHPVPSPRMRQQLLFGPLKGEAMAGLLFQVEDVRALDELAAAWGLRASVTDEDAEAALALWRGDEDLVAVPEA
jgi:hypothetical protein